MYGINENGIHAAYLTDGWNAGHASTKEMLEKRAPNVIGKDTLISFLFPEQFPTPTFHLFLDQFSQTGGSGFLVR